MNTKYAAACALILACSGAAIAQVTLVPGATLLGLSGDGSCAVGNMNGNAIRWTAAGGVQVLGPGSATAVSADGSVVVGKTGGSAIFRWTAATGMVTIAPSSGWKEPIVSYDGNSVAYGMSNGQAMRWTPAGTTPLPNIPGQSAQLVPFSISADGSRIVGMAEHGEVQGIVWNGNAPGVGLPWLHSAFHQGGATAMAANGNRIFGFSATNVNGSAVESVYWEPDGSIHVMHSPDSILRPSCASADGLIAMGIGVQGSYVWREGVGFRDFNDILLNEFGVDFAGNWSMAWGISSDGQTVAGYNSVGNGREGFIVHLPRSIPAPGAGAVVALAAVGLMARRRR